MPEVSASDVVAVRDPSLKKPISRRALLKASLTVAIGGGLAVAAGAAADFLYPRTVSETLVASLRNLSPGAKMAIARDGGSTTALLPNGRQTASKSSGWLV